MNYSNDLDNILNNNEHKLIFLKAILLGIGYGKSENVDFYIKNINNEINNITNSVNNPEIKKYDELIKKQENIIIQKEYQKNILISNIQKLSHNNYGYNHSRINLLKTNLHNLNIEIDKLKLNFFKNKEIKNKLENNKTNVKSIQNNIINNKKKVKFNLNDNSNSNLVGELEQTLGNLSNMFS